MKWVFTYTLLLVSFLGWAQSPSVYEAKKSHVLRRDSLRVDSFKEIGVSYLNTLSAPTSVSWSTPYDVAEQNVVSSNGLIVLEVDHNYYKNAGDDLDYTFSVEVTTFNLSLVKAVDTIQLRVENRPTSPTHKSITKAARVYNDIVYMQFKVLSIYDNLTSTSITDPKDNLSLHGEIELERYLDFDPTANCKSGWQEDTIFEYKPASSSLSIAQPVSCVDWSDALEWEIEWTYLDNYNSDATATHKDPLHPNRLLPAGIEFSITKNASRVRLPISTTSYQISNVFEEGYVLVRVRKLGRRGAAFNQVFEGDWLPSKTAGTVNTYPKWARLHIDNDSIPSHEEGAKTWQYVASYAEDGKNKEVVSYYDGLNKNRQAATRLSTNNTTVVGETVYDYQGRPAVQILPVPVNENGILRYYDSLNIAKDTTAGIQGYHARNFDNRDGADSLDSTYNGAGQYYSGGNQLNGVHKDYTPNAHGYPFTQTVFTKDGTGRVLYQSGVGPDHKIGSGHEIEYQYGKPEQNMLNALFGTESGYEKHYKESIVIDANGQMSVSYIDQHGRVVATSLAGESPENLEGLNSQIPVDSAVYLRRDLTGGNTLRIPSARPYAYELSYPYFSKGEASHKFWYEFQPEQYTLGCNSICLDCVYDLTVTISNTDTVLFDTTLTMGPISSFNESCNSSSLIKLWSGDSVENSSFSLVLPQGKYHIYKRFEINKDAQENYWEMYFNSDNSCFIPFDSFLTDAYQYVVDCDSVLLDLVPDTLSEFCRSMYAAMLHDVSPGGQYAAYGVKGVYYGQGGIITSAQYANMYSRVSVLNDSSILGAGNWKVPITPYLNETGDIDSIYDPYSKSLLPPGQTPLDVFIKNWKPSWAFSLVKLHPEYPYFELGINLESSFDFDDRLGKITTYAQALADSLVLPNDEDIILSKDPLYSIADDSTGVSPSGLAYALAYNGMEAIIHKVYERGTLVHSLKQHAAILECAQHTGDTALCKNVNNFGDLGLGTARLDAQWMAYRNIYQGRKQEIIDKLFSNRAPAMRRGITPYLRDGSLSTADSIQFAKDYGLDTLLSHSRLLSDKKRRYVVMKDIIGFDNFDEDEDALYANAESWMNTQLDSHCLLQCSSYVKAWRQDLSRCDATSIQIDNIIAGFLEVCKMGCNADYPLGTSTLPGADTTASGYRSFKDVLQTILGTSQAGNNYCNNLLIDLPKPYKHTIMGSATLTTENTDMDCACNLLTEKVREYRAITVAQDTCDREALKNTSYVNNSYRLPVFLNNLVDSGKITTNTTAFSLSNYPGFDTIKTLLKNPANAHSCLVKLEDKHGFSKLIISIYEDSDLSQRYNIELYEYKETFGSLFTGLAFSDFKHDKSFTLKGSLTKGFSISTKVSSTEKALPGRAFGFVLPKNKTVTTYDECLGQNRSSETLIEEFLAYSGWNITENELRTWQMACDGIRKLYINASDTVPGGAGNPFELGTGYFKPNIGPQEYSLSHWLNEAAEHDKAANGNAYSGPLSEDFSIGNEYTYEEQNKVFNFLPDSFTSFYQNLEGFYNIYDNFREATEDSIRYKCVNNINKFKNNLHIPDFIWGGYIGADDPAVDMTYLALGHIAAQERQYFNVYSGSFAVNDIDSIRNYRYNNYLDRYLVDVYLDVAGGQWSTLIFYNEYQEYNCGQSCNSLRQDWVRRPGKDYTTTCQLNQCRLNAMQGFLDHLASENKLNSTTTTDVSSYPGYYDADVSKSLKYFRRKVLSQVSHDYKALFNPDASTWHKDTLRAVIGKDTTAPVYITLSKTSSLNWGDIDSFYNIMLDTGKWVDDYIAKVGPSGAGYYFTLKGLNAAGTTEVVIRGYTNTFLFGTCNVSSSWNTTPSINQINEAYSAHVPATIRKRCPDCLECEEVYKATQSFYSTYTALGHNHMHHDRMLANYLNATFNNNLFPSEYRQFIEQCEMTDSLLLRRNTCGYSFTASSSAVVATLQSIRDLNASLDSTGQQLLYQRDSLSTGDDYYCFDLSSIGDSLYNSTLLELQTIATGAAYSGQSIDGLDSYDYRIELKDRAYTGACRSSLGSLLNDSISTLYPAITYDSVTVYHHIKSQLAPVSYKQYRLQFNTATKAQMEKVIKRLQDSISHCSGAQVYSKTIESITTWNASDSICPKAFSTGNKTCTSCEEIRQSVRSYTRDSLFAFDQSYESGIEGHLELDLQKSFTVKRVNNECADCPDKTLLVCEELSAQAEQLEVFLHTRANAGTLLTGGTLNSQAEFYQTTLHLSPAPMGSTVSYTPTSVEGDSMQINITDDEGFNSYVLLYAHIEGAFDFSNITAFKKIRVLPKYKGRNGWFMIDAYDNVSKRWHAVTGYASRYTITRCCEFQENKLCFRPYFREVNIRANNCDSLREAMARISANSRYQSYLKLQESLFKESYREVCGSAIESERFEMTYPQLQHHFTLYFYDIAGNLVRTVPPQGVSLNTSIDSVKMNNWRSLSHDAALTEYGNNPGKWQVSNHSLSTFYQYNTLNEVTRQLTPDGGESEFYYDRLGRLVFSQNAVQAERGHIYSYTRYDGLGRIREVGEMALPNAILTDSLRNDTSYFLREYKKGVRSQITLTQYDAPLNTAANTEFGKAGQSYLRNRVATTYFVEAAGLPYSYASHYSYDVHGNVRTVIHEYAELEQYGQRYKRIDYEYDLVSGNVNQVCYQKGEPDQFYHKYKYDADNRITTALTSKNQILWEQDARYEYYLHGPLARVVLGENQVQGLDYAYTLHGWLKGVNSELLDKTRDIGGDGHSKPQVAQDAFGFSLGYYQGDYESIGASSFVAQRGTLGFGGTTENKDLYNGNISHMASANRAMMEGGKGVLGMNYTYDQLNRIKSSESFVKTSNTTNTWAGVNDANIYSTSYNYDGNGNIMNLERFGYRDVDTLMDDLVYHYYPNSNQLKYVEDKAGTDDYFSTENGGIEDLNSGQKSSGNYFYDAIGNLVSDHQEGIANIDWTVYGKVSKVERADTMATPDLEFKYDASGNRIVKIVKPTSSPITWKYTYYARDAQGNVMAVYNLQNGLEDSTHNVGLITSWLVEQYGLSAVATLFNDEYGTNTSFLNTIIAEVETSNLSETVMNAYTIGDILSYDDNYAITEELVESYHHDTVDFYAIIDSFLSRYRSSIADYYVNRANAYEMMYQVLKSDPNGNFLNCFSLTDLQNLYTTLYASNPPTVKADVIDSLTNLDNDSTGMLSTSLIAPHLDSKVESYYDTCISKALFRKALGAELQMSHKRVLTGLSLGLRDDLYTFFTTNGDADADRPLDLLKQHGTHQYILNVLADNDSENFIKNAIPFPHQQVLDNTLEDLDWFNTTTYLQLVRKAYGQSVEEDLLDDLGAVLIYCQKMRLAEHHIYGSSRLGMSQDTTALYNMRFKADSVNSSDGSFYKSDTLGYYTASVDSLQAQRQLSLKKYELSNHLGNVLAVVSDKRTYLQDTTINGATVALWDAYIASAQDYYPFGMLMPNRVYADTNQTQMLVRAITQYAHVAEIDTFTVDTAGWTGTSGGAVSQANKQLVVTADHENEATLRSYTTTANQKYQLLLDLDHGDCDSIKVDILDSASTVIASYSNVATSLSYQFTAVNSETNVKVSRQDKNGQNINTFYLNSAVLSEIRDTLYQDTIYTATGNGYRFAFNGMERDDEWNGVGNSYNFGARVYDPRLGRWLARDPLERSYVSISTYCFVGNNPIKFIDPDGKKIVDPDSEDALYIKAKLEKTEAGTLLWERMVESPNEIHIHVVDAVDDGKSTDQNSPKKKLSNYAQIVYAPGYIIHDVQYEMIVNDKADEMTILDQKTGAVFNSETGEYDWPNGYTVHMVVDISLAKLTAEADGQDPEVGLMETIAEEASHSTQTYLDYGPLYRKEDPDGGFLEFTDEQLLEIEMSIQEMFEELELTAETEEDWDEANAIVTNNYLNQRNEVEAKKEAAIIAKEYGEKK